ncbi:extracellular solute-binding protein [Paenibacillus harenae]|uniref:extracellular solute-binding protein n=1 Tax=Paenibacillus harenae TaxID=306543 RepID=UPI002792E70C|nr:extracellular solute-binding protein [Paenibacillus harenae]MDQ0058982.1 ABC-type glycerol-3-phosphate transport system substrate-binding protein [Paenibacillus harenae]
MKIRLPMIILIVILFNVSACSNSNDSNQGKDQPTHTTPDPFGKYEEPVTIRIGTIVEASKSLLEGETLVDNQYTRNIKENLNIIVDYFFKASTVNYHQKVSLAIASNDLPDAMIVGPVELKEMVEADQLADLTDVYNEYASPVIKRIVEGSGEEALNSVTFDGKIMAIPNMQLTADGVRRYGQAAARRPANSPPGYSLS